jgi:hypothetical protein
MGRESPVLRVIAPCRFASISLALLNDRRCWKEWLSLSRFAGQAGAASCYSRVFKIGLIRISPGRFPKAEAGVGPESARARESIKEGDHNAR